MANDSSTGGYLAPLVTTPPTEDADLDAQLQAMVVGITGLNGLLVMPRWQPTNPKQPDRTVTWCAIGITGITPDDNAAITHRETANVGSDEMQRHEIIDVLASFYGPGAYTSAVTLRDGLYIAQNREALQAEGIALVATDRAVQTGDLVNQGFIRRVDLTIHLRRIVVRSYAILDILSSAGTVSSDDGGSVSFNVVPSP